MGALLYSVMEARNYFLVYDEEIILYKCLDHAFIMQK